MGSATVRITAADFVTPPEFRGLRLAAWPAGQIGGVRLELTAGGGKTCLGSCYQQVPVRVLPPFHFAGEPAALLYLLNPTAGLMEGDGHLIDLTVSPGARVVVTSQSATRIHPCRFGFSTQQWHIRVKNGGQLVVLPGPAIPFQQCRYFQRVSIHLAPEARLIWGDIWLPGRYARAAQSELFQFDRLIQDLQVWRDDILVFRDRFSWQGPWHQEARLWHVGNGLACGSLFISKGEELLHPAACRPLECVVMPLAAGDTCMRWCGPPEEVTKCLVACALKQASRWRPEASTGPWLLSGHHLAPNHWFASGAGCLEEKPVGAGQLP